MAGKKDKKVGAVATQEKKDLGGTRPFKKCKEQAKRIAQARGVGCSIESIAVIEGMPESTIRKHYSDCLDRPAEVMKRNLRSVQYSVAVEDRNVRMLEWLGKQYLGQTDKQVFSGSVAHTTDQILQDLDGRTRGLPKDPADS